MAGVSVVEIGGLSELLRRNGESLYVTIFCLEKYIMICYNQNGKKYLEYKRFGGIQCTVY